MSIPINNTLISPTDNLSQWTRKYPSLYKKNFLGISRIWDQKFPPSTFATLPFRNTEFHFAWRVTIDPAMMAPYVQEGADTPMADAETKLEHFVCKESRLGSKISQREIGFGLPNVVQNRTTSLVDAINLTREWQNIQALTGTNVNQPLALTRLNLAQAGVPHGTGTPKAWDESGGDIIKDILAMKTDMLKKSGKVATDIYIPINEFEHIHNDPEIIDQLRYTSGTLLVDGRLTMIKGVRIHVVASFWKERKKNGEEEKHFILENKVIMTTGIVGFTAVAEPQGGSAPQMERWLENKSRSIFIHAFSSFVPVVEDYGKIGIITGTDSLTP
jgi:hypothetical protein